MNKKRAVEIAQEATSNIKDPARRAELLIAAMHADATRELVNATTSLRYAVNQLFLDAEQAHKQMRDEDPGKPAFLVDLGSELQEALMVSGSDLLEEAMPRITAAVAEALVLSAGKNPAPPLEGDN